MITSAWLILGLPLLTALAIWGLFQKNPKGAGILATASMFAAFLLSCSLISQIGAAREQGRFVLESSVRWLQAGSFSLDFGVYLNGLSLVMLLVVTGIGTLVFLFSTAYMAGDKGYTRYFACLSFFTFSMLGIVLANNLIQIFIFWELVGLSSYLLIGFWFEKKEACTAAKKAFMTTRVGDAGMMIGLLGLSGFLAAKGVGSFNFTAVAASLPALQIPSGAMTLIALGLFLGIVGKSAQVPLHVWLPDAMEGPTPVSALIHAATMVAAGIFLLARVFFIFEASADALQVIAWTGAVTAFLAATLALVQNDIKKILAYSTVSQLGYMVMALGLSSGEAAIFHLTMHAFFKALLFLGAGSLIHAFHSQDIWAMGSRVQSEGNGRRLYLFKAMPFTSITFLVGTLALMGIPPLSGFYSKEAILAAASHGPAVLFILALVTVFLTAFYNGRLFTVVFLPARRTFGESAHKHPLHEGGPAMILPLVILGILSVFGASLPFKEWLSGGLEAVREEAHGAGSLALLSISFALAGFLSALLLYFKRTEGLRKSVKVLAAPGAVLERKYGFDEFYDRVFSVGQDKAARLADIIERYALVEWSINGLGRLTRSFGEQLRKLQTGVVQFYAFVFTIGLTVTLYLFITTGRM